MKQLLLLILLSLLTNCKKDIINGDDELTIQRVPYTGDQLRINGYYYQELNSKLFDVYLFYENGVVLYAGGRFDHHSEIESYIHMEFLNRNEYKSIRTSWGYFITDGTIIKFERWYPGHPPLKAYVREGQIMDDETFVITESYRVADGQKTEIRERNETYHFREFSLKPDSSNSVL